MLRDKRSISCSVSGLNSTSVIWLDRTNNRSRPEPPSYLHLLSILENSSYLHINSVAFQNPWLFYLCNTFSDDSLLSVFECSLIFLQSESHLLISRSCRVLALFWDYTSDWRAASVSQRWLQAEKKESDARCCREATETLRWVWQEVAELLVVWKRTRRCWQQKAEAEHCCVWVSVVFLFYLVLDLNFFPKALSSSGTDRVRVKEPSDSDLTTRAFRWVGEGKT